MYRFQIHAETQPGETIALIGSVEEMGSWNLVRCVRLQTDAAHYPLWWVDLEIKRDRPVEYKYVRVQANYRIEWESLGSVNRWVPLEADPLPSVIIVEDGWFGAIPTYPYGYFAAPIARTAPPSSNGLKVVVVGSSVAMGCSAWLLRGWAWHLGQALQQQYGHHLVNVSALGANVGTTIAHFQDTVAPEQPDIVILALSLGNEGLASCSPAQRTVIQHRFENGLQQLLKMTQELGAYPILGGVYPHGHYDLDHYAILQATHQRMLTWGVPILDWLAALDDGTGQWEAGIAFDAAHPNTKGHQLMYDAIDLQLFDLQQADGKAHLPMTAAIAPPVDQPLYQDNWGFNLFVCPTENRVRVINTTPHDYALHSDWLALQTALQNQPIAAGLYVAEYPVTDQKLAGLLSFWVQENGTIVSTQNIPSKSDLTFYPPLYFFTPQKSEILFYDGQLSLLKVSDRRLYVINESEHEYNIQPMWKEIRTALKAMPSGVYEDPCYPMAAFRTLMIGQDGLESRVKAPAHSAMALAYRCGLSEVNRIAILPLGARCAVRMLLYKLEYDGPAFPFDLTRTTNLADVADMIHSGFQEMWNPMYLHYDHDARRIYHTKWTGLSFAHEVDESDDPLQDLSPVHERMRVRYTARSRRFWYAIAKSDEVLFVRTGVCDRGAVIDLVAKLQAKCQGKPFRLLLLSPQDSGEFSNLPQVIHYNVEFNPDRMYEDADHWLYCTEVMREILTALGISSQNLFWCPPQIPAVWQP